MDKKDVIKKMADQFSKIKIEKEVRIMEVCGTHTTEFFKTGVKDIFPENLTLVDGPGCPVCVTSNDYLDRAIQIGKDHNAILTTFGDMIKVPSSYSSLGKEKSEGMSVEIIYSPMECLELAEKNPDREVVFLSVGFETTIPTEAATVIEAKKRNIKNFSILAGNKLTPPAVKALLDIGEANIHGFLLPGHVSAVVGSNAWKYISEDYGAPTVIAGFEAHDLIQGTFMLVNLIQKNKSEHMNLYPRVVKDEGNKIAQDIITQVFEISDSHWRGIGVIPGSGLKLNENYSEYDAEIKLPVTTPEPKETKGCRCGELLRGLISPFDCPLFGKACVPEKPVGPCMVSTEGPCAAYYKYGRK